MLLWVWLSRVTFGESSSLKLIGDRAFCESGVVEFHIPEGVGELCESCFAFCFSLSRLTFGESSSLKLVSSAALSKSSVREIHIPDSVEELCDACFDSCSSLSCVTFGESSSMRRIGAGAFSCSRVSDIHIPDSVEEVCESCFYRCERLSRVTFGESSSLKRIGARAFYGSGISSFSFPASVVSVGGGLFSECLQRNIVICDSSSLFSIDGRLLLSKDRRVLYSCIGWVKDVIIPDDVEELCDACFEDCMNLSRVTFGESSSLKRIGEKAFDGCGVRAIHIPDGLEDLVRRAIDERCHIIKLA